jgi:hypothetical protein
MLYLCQCLSVAFFGFLCEVFYVAHSVPERENELLIVI